MTSRKNILDLVNKWDDEEISLLSNTSKENIPITKTYSELAEKIDSLVLYRFVPYLNDDVQDFYGKLWLWINQFDTDDEKKIAFKLVANITYITEDQIKYLQEVCFQEKIRYRLLEEIISEQSLPPYSYKQALSYFDKKLDQCLIIPLTDSARYNQFVHINNLENHSSLGVKCLDVFTHPDIRNTPEVIEKLTERYAQKQILIIIEDFCGSGKTFTSDLVRIANLYPIFRKIYFCPYIITERALRTIKRFASMYGANINLKILYGMTLSNEMRVLSQESHMFTPQEKIKIKALCEKYHQRYFTDHKYIGTPRSFPFGYKNGQLLFVFQSNCPNHTIPIIWAYDQGWFPLFRRVQRYA